MNMKLLPMVGLLLVGLYGCNSSNKTKQADVVSQRYIHKYGYDVSKDEWNSNHYPGQIVTTLKNGITIVSAYEDGVLHGPTSCSYPYSQTLETLQIYEKGHLVKKTSFDIKGVPQKEELFLSPGHVKAKLWYSTGTPMCVEERLDDVLLEGEYYTLQNELESKVENRAGIKTLRSQDGSLLAKETISQGGVAARETFHINNTPHTIVSFRNGLLHGEKRMFGITGEPILVENYECGELQGACTYYQNGYKYQETPYRHGKKHGIERQYIDGESLVEETEYYDGLKHGPSTFYVDGLSKTEWYYNNEFVSKGKFEELTEREKTIAAMHERARAKMQELEEESFEFDTGE